MRFFPQIAWSCGSPSSWLWLTPSGRAMSFVAGPILKELKAVQRDTVDHVFRRLFLDEPSAQRFLVADEVGLGKTLVARGVIARAVEWLQQKRGPRPVTVVYICSSQDLAKQNIERLVLREVSSTTHA